MTVVLTGCVVIVNFKLESRCRMWVEVGELEWIVLSEAGMRRGMRMRYIFVCRLTLRGKEKNLEL